MKFLRNITSGIIKLLMGIIALLILYLLTSLILTLIPVNSDFKESSNGTNIFVSSNGVHVNIIIPSNSLQYSWTEEINQIQYKYLAFGWGDKEFYMNTPNWSDIKLSTILKAAFIPTSAVIQVYGLHEAPKLAESTKSICLSGDQLKTLSDYIYHSFQLNNKEELDELFPSNKESSFYKYYQASGKYSLFFTCNNWANKGLKKSGVKNSVWAPFDKSVLYHLK